MPIDAPLTFGQLSTWRSIETFAPDRLMEVNVPAVWDLDGLDRTEVERGLRRLVERHEALRTTFHRDGDGRPFQRVHDRLPLRVESLELPERDGAAGSDHDLRARVLRELHARPFAVTGDAGWHGVLVSAGGRPRFLAVSFSHMVVDVWAIRELEAQFRVLAGDPQGLSETATTPGPAPRELAALQHGETWASRRRGAQKHWARVLATGPVRNFPAAEEPGSPQRRIQVTLSSHRLAVLTGEAAALHGLSPQSVLTTMTAAALGAVLGRDRVLVSVMCANRFDPQWLAMVSTMNQLVPLVCAVDPGAPLASLLKRTHLNALLAYRHGSYDVDAAAAAAATSPGPDGSVFDHDTWFNYVADPERPVPPGITGVPPAVLSWTPPPRNAGHPFYVRVNGDGRTSMEVTVRADPDRLPAQALVTLLRVMALGVERAVTAPQSTPADLFAAAEDALPPELFPCGSPFELAQAAPR
jgi:hypothetical protein